MDCNYNASFCRNVELTSSEVDVLGAVNLSTLEGDFTLGLHLIFNMYHFPFILEKIRSWRKYYHLRGCLATQSSKKYKSLEAVHYFIRDRNCGSSTAKKLMHLLGPNPKIKSSSAFSEAYALHFHFFGNRVIENRVIFPLLSEFQPGSGSWAQPFFVSKVEIEDCYKIEPRRDDQGLGN